MEEVSGQRAVDNVFVADLGLLCVTLLKEDPVHATRATLPYLMTQAENRTLFCTWLSRAELLHGESGLEDRTSTIPEFLQLVLGTKSYHD